MYDIRKCDKIEIDQGTMYLGESTEEKSVGYLELKPHSSLTIHNRVGAVERLTQVKGACVMIIFDRVEGRNCRLNEDDTLTIQAGIWHIHVNPFDRPSLTYWDFDGDIRSVIETIRKKEK